MSHNIIVESGSTVRLPTSGKYCDRDIVVMATDIIVPEYWRSYLATKAAEINAALDAAGENKSAFLWYTDAHWVINYGKSPMLLKYLSKNTDMKKTFFGGDVSNAKSGEIDLLTAWQELVKDIPNHRSVIGNHDNQVTELSTAADRADFFILSNRTEDMASGTNSTNGKMYYYVDSQVEKTRYICLSTGRMWTNADEVEWCIEVLNSTPKNWHIVIISHLWLNNDYTNGGVITTPEDYTQGYLDMFDAYNYRRSGTESFTGKAYSFTNAQAKVEFIIGGHTHMDYDFTTAAGIPVILTESDCYQERSSTSTATQGTTTENCVFAVVADYAAKAVKLINVGRGTTRTKTIPDVVTYTNWAKKAVDTDGVTIYNGGKGYMKDNRVNSSGTNAAATGWDVTGYIPVRIGDIVRLKNCTFYNMSGITGTNRSHITFYTESFEYQLESSSYTADSPPSSAWSPVHGENGDLIQFKVPTSYPSSIRWMRITMDDINDNSIITVNEVID